MTHHPIGMLRRAVKLFNSDLVPASTNKRNRIAWLRAVHTLGDKWLLAGPVNKEQA